MCVSQENIVSGKVIAAALHVVKRFAPYKNFIFNYLKPYSKLKNIKISSYGYSYRVKTEV
jgi:hypothetical protein